MNNRLMDIITRKDKKRYNQIIKLINQKDYKSFFDMIEDNPAQQLSFGLDNEKYNKKVIDRINQEISDNFDFLIQMDINHSTLSNFFTKSAIEINPKIVEKILEYNEKEHIMHKNKEYLLLALDNGYNPPDDFINNHYYLFDDIKIMKKVIDLGYKPNNEIIEKLTNVFSDEELFTKIIDLGYVPSSDFIIKSNILKNSNLIKKVFDVIGLTPEIINGPIFYGNVKAQRYVIDRRPDLLLKLDSSNEAFEQFWIEAFKQGNKLILEEGINKNYYVGRNLSLIPRIIKQNPELIKKVGNYAKNREEIDTLALCMGYVPTIEDAKNNEYVRNSKTLMKSLILKRPEAIKYFRIGQHYFREELNELATIALDNGYIPTLKDIEYNPLLKESFDIMKYIVQENPDAINQIIIETPNHEGLLKVAIENGFNGKLKNHQLLNTDTSMIYKMEHMKDISSYINELKSSYNSNHSTELYNYFKKRGCQTKDIYHLFSSNYEVMKEIIATNPEYINKIQYMHMNRKQIDELGILAIEKGYEPKFEDDVFAWGSETAKMMVKKYPKYFEKLNLFDSNLGAVPIPCGIYDEVCKMYVDAGFMPDINTISDMKGQFSTYDYNYSYDIMKKAISINPKLIECCWVRNKEQYDELCRLALSKGYDITKISGYILNLSNNKMRTNYDLMAKYIEKNPRFLQNIEITNSDELLKLIDIAIESDPAFKLDSLGQKALFKLFLFIDETKWSNYLDNNTIENLQKLKTLAVNNDEISSTLNPRFLSEDITNHFTKSQIEILSCYRDLQDKILKLSNSDKQKFNIICELVDKYKDNLEWIPILEKVIDNINNPEFINLLESVKDKELSSKDKEELIYLLMTDNHLDISTEEELKNIDSVKENYIKILIERNTIGSLKEAYFEKTFGIDLTTAIYLVNTYGKSLESDTIKSLDENSRKEFIILENMKDIINLNSIEVLKYYIDNINPEFKVKPDLMVTYEARLKYLFTKEFNKSFAKPQAEDKVISNIEDENDYDIYLAAGKNGNKKCRMMITSIGAYTNMDEPDDYYASWNVNKIASHGCCCSYVGEKNLGTARIKYCCLGFTDYEPGSLQLSGPFDLYSGSDEKSYKIKSYPPMFLLPEDLLDYTRYTHNEMVWERRNISNNVEFKKQPSYIVYFVDNFEDRLTDSEAKKQWESVKRAAASFATEVDGVKKPLPIMVVEREKIAASQIKNIQNKVEDFKKTLNPDLIKEIVSDYESNYTGNREYHPTISVKYFPHHDNLSDSVVGEIINTIKEKYKTNPNMALKCLDELEKAVKKEQEKYNAIPHGDRDVKTSFNITDAMIEVSNMKTKYKINKDSILNTINKSAGNEKQYEKRDIYEMDAEMLNEQLSFENVMAIINDKDLLSKIIMYENEINDEKINAKFKVHGQRHIKNVLLYSAIIGKQIAENEHDLDLIMLAAKYHDIGRKTEAHEEHAEPSARIADEKLRDKVSFEDLAIIKTIIEFHEVPRRIYNVDNYFLEIAEKNGVSPNQITRVRKMAEVLKDADALDRTRFINRARLNPYYLKYDISKQLVKFASSLQETYALQDLKDYQCDEAISTLLNKYTPQEVIRIIRHSNRGVKRIEDIQKFINLWAESIKNNLEVEKNNSNLKEGIKHGK
ncbi:MAG: HD domain-containing protein [Bacilli bacterium]|nr:HD domain-containing protein [Bacilli bacterium]